MESPEDEFFEVRAVARLTGVSPHVLRIWERRYGVVSPRRSDTKRRRYTRGDIQRLSLLKTLVDHGHAIGSIAPLSTAQLEERLSGALEARADGDALETAAPAGACRVAVVGSGIGEVVRGAADRSPALRIVGEFGSPGELLASLRPGAIDLLVLRSDTIFPEDIAGIQELVVASGARRAILVYRFAREDTIRPLDLRRITALRAPVDAAEIQLACIADIQLALRSGRDSGPKSEASPEPPVALPPAELPARRFSDEQLVRIGRLSSVVKCECPQHLANLLSGLVAFERYSEQCENRNPGDAEMHAFLHRATAECRAGMEEALARLLAQEGVEL